MSRQRRFHLLLASSALPCNSSLRLPCHCLLTYKHYLLLCHSHPNLDQLLFLPSCEVLPSFVRECFRHRHIEKVKDKLVFENLGFGSIGAHHLSTHPPLGLRYLLVWIRCYCSSFVLLFLIGLPLSIGDTVRMDSVGIVVVWSGSLFPLAGMSLSPSSLSKGVRDCTHCSSSLSRTGGLCYNLSPGISI
jgi:hypothetical protein